MFKMLNKLTGFGISDIKNQYGAYMAFRELGKKVHLLSHPTEQPRCVKVRNLRHGKSR